MVLFPDGTETPFARAVAAEVRAVMAAQRLTLRDVAAGARFKSHNYLAIRLRDEKPFTLDDVERLIDFFSDGGTEWESWRFLQRAISNHEERYWLEASEIEDRANYIGQTPSAVPDFVIEHEDGSRTVIEVKGSGSVGEHNLARLLSARMLEMRMAREKEVQAAAQESLDRKLLDLEAAQLDLERRMSATRIRPRGIRHPNASNVSVEEDNIEDLYDEPSAAHPVPRNDVEGDLDPDLQ